MADRVVVGYCDSGAWSASFGLSYRDLLIADLCGPQRIMRPGGMELRVIAGTMGVASARNEISERFLASDGDWLLMIDTDMGFTPDVLDVLLDAADPVSRPVVGGLCFALKRKRTDQPARERGYAERFTITPTLYEYVELPDESGFRPMSDYPRGELVRVAGTGAAMLIMHRSALEKLRDSYGATWFDPITDPAGAKGRPRTYSEDLSLCLRLAARDIPIHVHTGVRTSHHKGGVYLDEHTYERDREVIGVG